MAYKTGIGIQLPFVLDYKGPLDTRSIVANMTELNEIPDSQKYNGMLVYVEAENLDYRWNATESTWTRNIPEITGATVEVGTVTTGEAGTEAKVENVGTDTAAILNFTIPKGDKGDQGEQGIQGEQGPAGADGANGADGADGKSATVKVGTVNTGVAGSDVIVSASTVEEDGVNVTTLNFTIPQGAEGQRGKAFAVAKQYASIAEMNADFDGTDVEEGEFVIINTDVNDEDNAKLYCKGAAAYEFVCDMSGVIGADGMSAEVRVGSVTTGAAGTDAVVTYNTAVEEGKNVTTLNFVIPRGADGAQGPQGEQGIQGEQGPAGADGAAATVAIGSVTTGDAGTEASVTNSGTENAAVLDFVIPRGEKGETGADGADGAAATIAIGTVTTGASTASASVENVGTENAAVLNFVVPKGDKGEDGDSIRVGEEYATAEESKIFFRVISSSTT